MLQCIGAAAGAGEAILGYRHDPMVGPIVVVGVGGTLAGMPMIAGPIMGFVLLQASAAEVAAMARLLGEPRETLIGRRVQDFVAPEAQQPLQAELAQRAQGAAGHYELTLQRADGQRVPCVCTATALFDAQGYANTTIEQIVQQLGVTKPFVYYYFRNKQEIFETLSWAPAVACFTAMDFAADDDRPAHVKVTEGIERLIRATLEHHPSAFFPYREPQVYRPEYLAAQKDLANHFYDRLCALLEQGRQDGMFEFNDTKITALAACSLPGFLYNWYRPDGRLSQDEVAQELAQLAWRVLGLRRTRKRNPA